MKINSFSITQRKTSWIYLDIAVFYNFKVFLLLPDARGDFAKVFRDQKIKQNCKFEFHLNCK